MDDYKWALGEWKQSYLEQFDIMDRILRQLAPGNKALQYKLAETLTYTEVAESFIEKLMFG